MKILKNQSGFGLIEGLLIVIALTLVVGVGYYVYNANQKEPEVSSSSIFHNDEKDNSSIEEQPAKQEEPIVAKLPELVNYGEEGIEVNSKSDTDKLHDTSEAFKSFIASKLPEKKRNNPHPEGFPCYEGQGFNVLKIYKDKFALGSIPCAGYAVWVKDVSWKELIVTQEVLQCSYVDKHNIPHQIFEECAKGFNTIKNKN